jgi:hypothetical protein
MIERVEPCTVCGAPPRYRDAVDVGQVHFSQQYCPVCDVPGRVPWQARRACVWLSDHRVVVRFRQPWFGGGWYFRLRGALTRPAGRAREVPVSWEEALTARQERERTRK